LDEFLPMEMPMMVAPRLDSNCGGQQLASANGRAAATCRRGRV